MTGRYDVTGNVEGVPFAAHANLRGGRAPEAENLLLDVGWEDSLARWNVEKSGCLAVQLFSGVYRSVPIADEYSTRRSTKKLEISICQTVKVQEAGTYTLSVALSGNRYNECGCAAVPRYGRGKRRDCVHPTEHVRLQSDMRNQKTAKSLPESNFIAADVRHDAEFLSAEQ